MIDNKDRGFNLRELTESKLGNTTFTKEDMVNHPSHYTWLKELCGIEVIDITRHMDFDLGNAAKYILRAGHKKDSSLSDTQKEIEDLKKAIWYINDKIGMLEYEYKTDSKH